MNKELLNTYVISVYWVDKKDNYEENEQAKQLSYTVRAYIELFGKMPEIGMWIGNDKDLDDGKIDRINYDGVNKTIGVLIEF